MKRARRERYTAGIERDVLQVLPSPVNTPPTLTLSKTKPVHGFVSLQRIMPGERRPPVETTLRRVTL